MALLDLTVDANLRRSPRTVEVERGLTIAQPGLRAILRRVAGNLLVACVIPALVFYSLFLTIGVWPAIVGALCWSYGAIGFRAATGRRTSGMLLLTAGVLTVRTVVALLAQSTFIYFLQPVLSDLVVGTAFLLSLLTVRPVVARLAGDFYPLSDEVAARDSIRLLFRRLTLVWAAVLLGKAVVVFCLLVSQPLSTFVLVRGMVVPTTNLTAIALTVLAAVAVGRREGLLAHGAAILPAWPSPTSRVTS